MSETNISRYEQPEGAYALYITTLDKRIAPNYGPRNKFIEKYNWRPHWRAEVTTALKGLNAKLEEAYNNGGLKSAYITWDNARRYRVQASTTVLALRSVKDPEANDFIEADSIRINADAMTALASYMLAVNHLDEYRFPPHNRHGRPTKTRLYQLADASEQIAGLADGDLKMLARRAFLSEAERMKFWDRQLESVAGTEIVKDIQEAIESAHVAEYDNETGDKI